MQKISDVLRQAHQNKTKQTTGYLVKFDSISNKPKSYCALGALACNKHHFKNVKQYTAWQAKLEKENVGIYASILREYDVPEDLMDIKYSTEFEGSLPLNAENLAQLIYKLNDQQEFNFEQLADLLETNLGL